MSDREDFDEARARARALEPFSDLRPLDEQGATVKSNFLPAEQRQGKAFVVAMGKWCQSKHHPLRIPDFCMDHWQLTANCDDECKRAYWLYEATARYMNLTDEQREEVHEMMEEEP